jgi:hypothetical protein
MAEPYVMPNEVGWTGSERRTNVRLRAIIDRMHDELAAIARQIAALRSDVEALKRVGPPVQAPSPTTDTSK